VNRTDAIVDAWVDNEQGGFAVFWDPVTGNVSKAEIKQIQQGVKQFRIRLLPHSSLLVTQEDTANVPTHQYFSQPSETIQLSGKWKLEFREGGPIIPSGGDYTNGPDYWTNSTDSSRLAFSGMAEYSTRFQLLQPQASQWLLDLGSLSATAEVWLNGKFMGISIGPKHVLAIPEGLLKQENLLQVKVASLMANRIADMDRKEIPWKIFYNINMSARRKENVLNGVFDARHWKPIPSGLAGPVQLFRFPNASK
jgi:hypothetical protein